MENAPLRTRPHRRRPHLVNVRLDDAELAAVTAAAEARGLTPSGYLFELATQAKAPARTRRPTFDIVKADRLLAELGSIGSNVNQIARALNRGREVAPPAIDAAAATVIAAGTAILDLLGRAPRRRFPSP